MSGIALRVRMVAALGAVALTGGGCEDPDGGLASVTELEPGYAEAGSTLTAVSPLWQDGLVGQPVEHDPTVRALDPNGAPMVNEVVRFAVVQGGGTITERRVRTDSAGLASVGWTLGDAVGRNQVRAALPGVVTVRFVAMAMVPVGAVSNVDVTPGSVLFESIDETEQMTAHSFDAEGNVLAEPVTWTSRDPGVVTIDSTGLLIAVANGLSDVIATSSNGIADTAEVEVAQRVATVRVVPAVDTIAVGTSAQLIARAFDATGHRVFGVSVIWASSNPAVASVDSNGLVSGAAEGAATITATIDGITDQSRIVVGPSSGTTRRVQFFSDWASALGSTSFALLDGSKTVPWSGYGGNNPTGAVVAQTLATWPTARAYRVGVEQGASAVRTHQLFVDAGEAAAGSVRYYRYYFRMAWDDSHGSASIGNVEHGIETSADAFGGGDGANPMHLPRADGTWFMGFRDITSGQRWYAGSLRLAKNRTYRIEMRLAFGSSSYNADLRIYDDAGNLVATGANFEPINATTGTLNQSSIPMANRAAYRWFRVGTNGPSSNFPLANLSAGDDLFYFGAVAICQGTWCGAYDAARGD